MTVMRNVRITLGVMMMAAVNTVVNGKLFYVGGSKWGWKPNVNLSEWSSFEQFYVGDWLYFGFDKHTYNVLEVNKTSYESCNDQDYMNNITRGGRDVYELREPKTYYFICGRGFCYEGMRVAINVEHIAPPPPFIALPPSTPLKANTASPSTHQNGFNSLIVLSFFLRGFLLSLF